eukprot:11228265-Lingulodinium_polyedra.AAC.1
MQEESAKWHQAAVEVYDNLGRPALSRKWGAHGSCRPGGWAPGWTARPAPMGQTEGVAGGS